MSNRYARQHKRDSNSESIATALRLAGWSVFTINANGFPDLLCVRQPRVVLIEVKTKEGRLTEPQKKLFPLLKAAGLELHVVTTPEEALAAAFGTETHIEALAKAFAGGGR